MKKSCASLLAVILLSLCLAHATAALADSAILEYRFMVYARVRKAAVGISLKFARYPMLRTYA